MKSSMSVLVASLFVVACGTASKQSSTSEAQPMPVKLIADCVTNFEKDNLKVYFFENTYSQEIQAEVRTADKDEKLVRELNVCRTEDHGSIMNTICHDVNFTDTYTVDLYRSGWFPSGSAELTYVSEKNPFEAAKMRCTIAE